MKLGWLLGIALTLLMIACGGSGNVTAPTPAAPPKRLRMEVQTQGLYRVTYENMVAAGFVEAPVDAGALRLTCQGKAVALRVKATGGRVQTGDFVEFLGEGCDTEYTEANVYWLSQSGGTAAPLGTRSVADPGGTTPTTVCQDLFRMEENHLLWAATPGAPIQDYWFWAKLTAPVAADYAFQVDGLAEDSGGSTLRVFLQGASSGSVQPDHHVRVNLNGSYAGEARWEGMAEFVVEIPLPKGQLKEGANTINLDLPGDTGAAADVVYLNRFEIVRWRPLRAQGDALAFRVGGGFMRMEGFSTLDIRLFDITDSDHPVELIDLAVSPGTSGFQARFRDSLVGDRRYFALTGAQVRKPSNLASWRPGTLREGAAGADYVLITPRAFLEAAQPLVQLRRSQGMRVTAIAIEDVFNEFGYGQPDPQAIKDLLAYAVASWPRPAPTRVLLLGDASIDYRDRMGTGKLSRVPAHLSSTFLLGLTPDDNWYAALNPATEEPQLMIGRLPAANPAQVADLAQKILRFEGAVPPAKALFVADNNTPSFKMEAERLSGLLPATFTPRKVYLGDYTDFTLATRDIVGAFNEGMLLVTYAGHGDVTEWAGERVFNAGDLPDLYNANHLPVCLVLNCLNGYFAKPGMYCFAESLVAPADRGAIALLAASGLGYEWEQSLLATAFYGAFFDRSNPTLGEVFLKAKTQAYRNGASGDLLKTITLIGDPGLRVRLP